MLLKSFILAALLLQPVLGAILGVDYGADFTKAILVAPNVAFDILLTPDSKRKEPSGLSFVPTEDFTGAVRKYGTNGIPDCSKNPQFCFYNIKSLLGQTADSNQIEDYRSKFPGSKITATKNLKSIVFMVNQEKDKLVYLYPEEVLAMQLRDIKTRALEVWKEASPDTFDKDGEITELVISVPRYFTEAQREAIYDAAGLAGLSVIRLVDDGLATAIDFAQKREIGEELEKFLIFDAGASAIKATVVGLNSVNSTLNIETLGYGFDQTIGGQLFTETLRNLIVEKFAESNNVKSIELYNNAKLMRRIWQTAERTKLVLSANSESSVSIESFYNDIDLKQIITREDIENQIKANVKEGLFKLLDNALEDVDKSQLNGIVLSGGSFRVPLIQTLLKEFFGGDELFLKSVNADESVVFGTTIEGASLKGLTRRKRVNIIDHDFRQHFIKYAEKPIIEGLADYPILASVERGAISPESHTLNLTASTGYINEFQVEVYDDLNEQTHYYNFTMPRRFNESACDEYEYYLNYGNDEDNLFGVNYLKTKCTKNGAVRSGNLLKQVVLYGYERIGSALKVRLTNKLDNLDVKDEEQKNRTELINTLESSIYETRYLLEDNEEIMEELYVTEIGNFVVENLAWIEDESETAALEDIHKKINQMEHSISIINGHRSFLTWDSAMETLEEVLGSIQKSLEETVRVVEKVDIAEEKLKSEISERGLDYDHMISMLAYAAKPGTQIIEQIREQVGEIKDILELVESVDSDGYEYLIKDGWVNRVLLSKIYLQKLNALKEGYKSTWDNRSSFIQHQLAEVRDEEMKLKRKKKRAMKKKQLEDAVEIETPVVETEKSKTTEAPVRDEL